MIQCIRSQIETCIYMKETYSTLGEFSLTIGYVPLSNVDYKKLIAITHLCASIRHADL